MSMNPRQFYEKAYSESEYALHVSAQNHPYYAALTGFIVEHGLSDQRCLEIGTGRGAFQDLVSSYVGVDVALSAGRFLRRPFAAASATALPFKDEVFSAIWTITVLEHVPDPEQALQKIWRVLKPGGYLFLAPAWQCRPWAAQGYPVRPYSDFNLWGKFIKMTIPVRNSVLYRSIKIFPQRLLRLLSYNSRPEPVCFRYSELKPNYDVYWMSDSGAVNSMDPFEAYLWFVSRGGECLNYPTLGQAFLVRNDPLIFRKPAGDRVVEAHD